MWRAWIAIACGACRFDGPGAGPTDAEPDAGADAAVDVIDFLPPSEERVGTADWMVGMNTVIDTTALSITPSAPAGVTLEQGLQDNGRPIAILRVRDLKIAMTRTLFATGDKPLAIVAGHDVVVDGVLDVGAHGATRGAGGALGGMGAGAGGVSLHDDGTGSMYDDSGGGGGSFGTAGARGGKVKTFEGGAAGATYAIDGLTGGSGGGRAGACTNPPGAGGGALLLYAAHRVQVGGAITAG
ncbi:MAG TPA: hypothetical protein VN253_15955, partial [Kofleriaceae bacterium]|nr:hypothetical protein [Kofleriaceae bacterium]